MFALASSCEKIYKPSAESSPIAFGRSSSQLLVTSVTSRRVDGSVEGSVEFIETNGYTRDIH